MAFESQNVGLTERKGRPILFNFLTCFKVVVEIFGGSRGVKGVMEYFFAWNRRDHGEVSKHKGL